MSQPRDDRSPAGDAHALRSPAVRSPAVPSPAVPSPAVPSPARHPAAILRWVPALAWMAVIFVLSSQSGLAVTEDPGVERPIRIVAHLATYALLGGLLLYAVVGWSAPGARGVLLAFGTAVLYGLSDELHQAFVPGRSGRLNDAVVDAAGAAIGIAVAAVLLGLAAGRRTASSAGPPAGLPVAESSARPFDDDGVDAGGPAARG